MKNDMQITHVSINLSMYALMQYLFLFDEDTIENHTHFFFGPGLNKEVCKNFKNAAFFPNTSKLSPLRRLTLKLGLRITKNWKYPFLKTAKIYAQDQEYPSILIGRRDYSLLSDGPNCITIHMNEGSTIMALQRATNNTLKGKVVSLIYGDILLNYYGNNKYCKEFFMTEVNSSPILEGKIVHVNPLQELWNNSSTDKQRYILSRYNLYDEDMDILRSKPIAYMSQPDVDNRLLSTEEQYNLVAAILKNYDSSQIIIKTHPRDTFDYRKYFPGITVFDKPVNMELLALAGIKFSKFITICSTSVFGIPYDTDIDWYGAEINPKLLAHYGEFNPNRPYTKMHLK
ncbi:MAG: hypothetical protein IKX38_00695 [Bacteroidales bacterium]|nr:hypothetical protein [Bacteroidales bacterium]